MQIHVQWPIFGIAQDLGNFIFVRNLGKCNYINHLRDFISKRPGLMSLTTLDCHCCWANLLTPTKLWTRVRYSQSCAFPNIALIPILPGLLSSLPFQHPFPSKNNSCLRCSLTLTPFSNVFLHNAHPSKSITWSTSSVLNIHEGSLKKPWIIKETMNEDNPGEFLL